MIKSPTSIRGAGGCFIAGVATRSVTRMDVEHSEAVSATARSEGRYWLAICEADGETAEAVVVLSFEDGTQERVPVEVPGFLPFDAKTAQQILESPWTSADARGRARRSLDHASS